MSSIEEKVSGSFAGDAASEMSAILAQLHVVRTTHISSFGKFQTRLREHTDCIGYISYKTILCELIRQRFDSHDCDYDEILRTSVFDSFYPDTFPDEDFSEEDFFTAFEVAWAGYKIDKWRKENETQ